MERSTGVTRYAIALILYGVWVLLGSGSYKQFAIMFEPFPWMFILGIYVFTIFYGASSIYCGIRILKLENWARKLILTLASISVILGLFLNRIAIGNLKEFLLSEGSPLTPEMVNPVILYSTIFIVIVTLFELSLIWFFTRPRVVEQF